MKCYKIRKKSQYLTEHDNKYNPEGWWCSGKGRDIWHSLGAVRGAIKTSYIPYNDTIDMYEIVEFDMVQSSTLEFKK